MIVVSAFAGSVSRAFEFLCAPVAQLDRAPGFEPVGRGFKSLRAHHNFATVRRIVTMRP